MSKELDYRRYCAKYFPGIVPADFSKGPDLAALANGLRIAPNKIDQFGNLAIPEFNFRAAISAAVGSVEERFHDTSKNENNTRVKPVPESTVEFHTRLCEELYQALTPVDATGEKE